MKEETIYNGLLMGWFVIAILIFILLFYVIAPYGRHIRKGWGPVLDNRLGWIIMEAVSPVLFAVCFMIGTNLKTLTLIIFFGMWEAHYIHRAFIYPLSLQSPVKRMPVVVIALGIFFNAVNAYLNGRYIFTFSDGYFIAWLTDPRFITGLTLFIIGFVINRQADTVLHNLRRADDSGYRVACTGLYHYISCPNYLGEILIWVGWATATWSLAGLSFAVWTIANLVPRARSNHNWYKENFSDYPPGRKALVPGLW